jgi:lysine 2,3-aminomutase
MGKFRVAVALHASLMDRTPVCRASGRCRRRRSDGRGGGYEDAIAETIDSPTTLITHRYPDRVLFITKDVLDVLPALHAAAHRGEHEGAVSTRTTEAFTYIERATEVRDVLISGGDPLVLSDAQLESILERVSAIDHVEIIRIGSRMPVVCPQRITPELVAMLRSTAVPQHAFNHRRRSPEQARLTGLADAGSLITSRSSCAASTTAPRS